MFKATPSRSADDVNREFDEMGAHYNAGTTEENTVYYAAVLPEYQHKVVALLADILRPSLREEDFNTEKQVILEEIKMYEDQPPFGADEKCRAAFFGPHPLGRSVLGTARSVTDLTVSAMRLRCPCLLRFIPAVGRGTITEMSKRPKPITASIIAGTFSPEELFSAWRAGSNGKA